MTHHRELFQPTGIGSCTLKNRISMAPMGPVGYADSFGGFNQRLQDYYVERAKNRASPQTVCHARQAIRLLSFTVPIA